ncbi:MAG: glycosyltransferase family 4 protein [Rhodobiaceae bacterium]|nr:glycosyltransferase family 4 protein [Rhodobiaceae bacterium]MCC0047820.1 glycosyltransferase family 4 protein [Rhodobiaceae bacterium]
MPDTDTGKLRIVHCFRAPLGGLFRHVIDLAGEQAKRGHDVGIICDSTTGGAMEQAQLDEMSRVCTLGIERIAMSRLPGLGDIQSARAAIGHLKGLKPDVVHGHGAKGGLYARMFPVQSGDGKPAITAYTPHGGSLNYKPGSFISHIFMTVERMLEKRTGVLLFESAFGRDVYFERVCKPTCEVRVVHNGVRESDFEEIPLDADATDLMFIGELRGAKGIDVLISALAELHRRNGDCPSLTIVGGGPDMDKLKEQAAPLNNRIRFVGPEPARKAFARGYGVVIPSRAESLPYVVLEAAALARPLITTNVGGIHEIFGPDKDWLIPAGDVDALAGKIADLDADTAPWMTLGERLRKRVAESFSVITMTNGVLEGYAAARARR